MYADPKRIRKHVLKLCLDDYETEVIDRIVRDTGEQRQVVLRKLMLQGLKNALEASEFFDKGQECLPL